MGEQIAGKITVGLAPYTLALRTIDFVQEQLPFWRDDPSRPDEESEKKLNLQLCKFLNTKARNKFPMIHFENEEPQSGRRSVDVSASPVIEITFGANFYHTIYDPVIVFECKRLPSPTQDREKEYVTGLMERNGGIQRFKLGLHGANHNMVAMIGYIQERSAREWHNEINKWIVELSKGTIADVCVWDKSEILKKFKEKSSTGIANCRSTHDRSGTVQSNKILIYHLWITMYRNTS